MGSSNSKVYPYKLLNIDNYWIGPYGMLVSNHIIRVRDPDQCNFVLRPGNKKTNAPSYSPILTKEEYLEKYATFTNDKYVFDCNEKNFNDIDQYEIVTKNKKGERRIYKMMFSGELYLQTPYYTKNIYPIEPVSKKPIVF